MNVLVTGGAGYIGTHAIPVLSNLPDVKKIIIYDNLCHGRHGLFTGEEIKGAEVQFIRGDLLDSRLLGRSLDGIDVVIHLAARVSTPFAHGDPHHFEQVNHWGSAELSYLLEESSVQRVIYVSSAAVYGLSEKEHDIDSTPQPNTWYGTSKLRAEKMLLRLQDQMDVIVLRCANVYGFSPSIRFDAVINRFVRQSHFEGRITVEGDGRQFRPFVHIDRVANILAHSLSMKEVGVFNLVDENIQIWTVVQAIQAHYPELEMMFVEQDMSRQSLLVRPSDELNSVPTTPLSENLRRFIKKFRF